MTASLTDTALADAVYASLRAQGMDWQTVHHPPAKTTAEADAYIEGVPGVRTKTLLLTNKKKTAYYLLVMNGDHPLDMAFFAGQVGETRLQFASAERLAAKLGTAPGVVSMFGLLNNAEHDVQVYFERAIMGSERLSFHPNDNRQTVFVASTDVLAWVRAQGHEPRLVDLPLAAAPDAGWPGPSGPSRLLSAAFSGSLCKGKTMITVNTLRQMKAEGNKIAMLTCYEASFAALMDAAGVDVLLVGDSLGMAVQGHSSTLPVRLSDMCYHTAAVARGSRQAMIVTDLPFGAYQQSKEQAFAAAAELMAAGAHMVKLEGGVWMAETTAFLQQRGIPVCAHIGLTPQSVNAFGGYKVQGKGDAAARALLADARAHEAAGADLVLMECVPAALGREVTDSLSCPTIGIGAGAGCDGQVLVMHDMLGVFPGKTARFVKNFMAGQTSIQAAVPAYVAAVKDGSFPAAEHSFSA